MIIKRSVLIISLFALAFNMFSQVEESVPEEEGQQKKSKFADKLIFGGDIGLSFGSITYIKLAPVVGYRLMPRLAAGLGPIYIYEKYKDVNLETSTYGAKLLASFTVFQGMEKGTSMGIGNLVIHLENELINVEPLYYNTAGGYYIFGDRLWIDNLLVGGGIVQPIAGNFAISMLIMWDVTQNDYSPYSNPIFKFGFFF
jgi:hypothetical protein